MSDAITYAQTVNDPANKPERQQVKRIQFVDANGNPTDITAGAQAAISTVKATALAAGVAPTASLDAGTLTLGIPAGAKGDPGAAGARGATGATGPAGAAGAKGADGRSVTTIALTADAAGKITGGTVTFSDKTTAAITVTTATA
ncbi:hypothetical protein [Bifidobacterium simiiventris]|uniref:hypothetical protein n=1 Tax=Bifidobacterium simiiventris TaxID=2834434 RepID=UPI001C5865D0|nr:hypothetical protein [Bifidobacterium simiiventris]MBW3077701.1 hypothetical protein [Bifidobacterium simiiventris]